jgi:DNA-binding IclR family transcriptional regulator
MVGEPSAGEGAQDRPRSRARQTRPTGCQGNQHNRSAQSGVDAVANLGYGRAVGEAEDGVGAIAVAIHRVKEFVGTMSVAAPLTRLTDERVAEILPLLARAARDMEIA